MAKSKSFEAELAKAAQEQLSAMLGSKSSHRRPRSLRTPERTPSVWRQAIYRSAGISLPDWKDRAAYSWIDKSKRRSELRWEFMRRSDAYLVYWARHNADKSKRPKFGLIEPPPPWLSAQDLGDRLQFYDERWKGEEAEAVDLSPQAIELFQDNSGVFIHFSLLFPIEPQLEKARERLKHLRQEIDPENEQFRDAIVPVKPRPVSRPARSIRALDACDAGVELRVIGQKIFDADTRTAVREARRQLSYTSEYHWLI